MKKSPKMDGIISAGLMYMDEYNTMTKELKERAIAEYKASLKMPRKKKKIAKKSAMLLYSIACYGENLM